MAEISPQTIQRPGVAQDTGVRMRPSTTLPSRIVDPVGQAVAGLGQEINSIADTYRALVVQRQNADDQVFLDRYQLELNKRYTTIESESVNSPEAAHPDYVNQLDKKLQETQKNVYDELTGSGQFNVSEQGRRKAEHAAMEMRAGSARRSAVAAHNQYVTGRVNIVNENILEVSRLAGSNGDVEANLARVDASVNSLNGILPPDKLLALRAAARSQIIESAAQGHIDRGEPDKARMLVDRNRGFAGSPTERVIAAAATKYGIDPAYLITNARVESNISNGARPPGGATTASGYFQFTEGTAKEYGLPADASTATVQQQADAAARLTLANKQALVKSLGREPTNGELYLAHFLGSGAASKVLTAPPGTPIDSVVDSKSIRANPTILEGKSVGDVIRWSEGKMMGAGGGGSAQYLDETARRRLLSAAETREHQNDVRTQQQLDRFKKDVAEQFMKSAFELTDKGELTTDFVERARPYISPTEYKGLLATVRGDNNIDDKTAVMDLMEAVDQEDPDVFMTRATDWMNEGKIKTTTFTSMVQRNRAARKDDAPESPYKSAKNYINTSLDPGALGGDSVTAQSLRFGRANAQIELDNWIKANPNAGRDAAIAEAQNIVNRYEPIAQENMRSSLGTSRYFNGATRNEIRGQRGMEIVEKAELALDKDITEDRLTREQQLFEVRLLRSWRAILAREAARESTPQPGGKKK